MATARDLSARITRPETRDGEPSDDPPRDPGDESISDEVQEERFREADSERTVLEQVREALGRIEDGTYGRCLVDGETMEEKRLQAIPWARYCLKHQQALEGPTPRRASL
jgi:DnaK suppressor protein